MVHRPMGFIYFLLFAVIHNAATICKISLKPDFLRISEGFNPLIYKYKSDGTPVIHYPSGSNCIFQSEDQQLHLACPGINNTLRNYYVPFNTDKEYFTANSSFVYLQHAWYDHSFLLIHGFENSVLVSDDRFIQCSQKPVATMHLLNAMDDTPSKGYVVGYRLNDLDFLKVYEQVYREEGWIVTRYKIDPAILSRPVFDDNNEYKKGLFFQKKIINFHDLYDKEYQVAEFQRYFKKTELTEKYFADNNLLVMGQLMFEEDTFYYSDQVSTRFYENTAPIWKSVYEGNWRTVGSVVRKIADASARGLDVQVCAWPCYKSNWTTWSLGNTSSSPDTTIPVPRILVKVAVDVVNPDRGIVFHTFNDPHLDQDVAKDRVRYYCIKPTYCQELHPEFQDMYKGYTFCCKPKHSFIFKEMKGTLTTE